jgi:hypothetical protein
VGKNGKAVRFAVGLKEGPILVDNFVTSGYDREVAEDTKDVLELSSVGE